MTVQNLKNHKNKKCGRQKEGLGDAGRLLNGAGALVRQGIENTEVLSGFSSPVFSNSTGLQKCRGPETGGK